ncbi:MAG: hypothetical protein ABIJ26_03590 [Candidatus Margulisiibacteriota bacterium]
MENPNTMAIKELRKMPALAGRVPRHIFNEAIVVMADLNRRKPEATTLYKRQDHGDKFAPYD